MNNIANIISSRFSAIKQLFIASIKRDKKPAKWRN